MTEVRLSDDSYAFMKGIIGMKAGCAVMDLASAETELRYASFAPVCDMLANAARFIRSPIRFSNGTLPRN